MPPSAPAALLILLFSALSGSTALLGRPNNVRLSSYNMNLVLRWDPPEGAASGLLYTAAYKSQVAPYRAACVNTSALECDFTSYQISEYGTYTGRVRVLRVAESSAWVESNPITVDRDTIIGPPSVSLISSGATVEISIKEPVFKISDVKNVYGDNTYNITYWKKSQSETGRKSQIIQQTRFVLSDLDAWSEYCVQVEVQVKTARNANPSVPSNVTCQRTTGAGHEAPWLAAVLVFVGISLVVALVVAVVRKRKSISKFLFPKDTLPQCLKESLPALPVSMLHPAKELHPGEEICHQVLLTTGDASAEEEEETSQPEDTESERQPDNRGRASQ